MPDNQEIIEALRAVLQISILNRQKIQAIQKALLENGALSADDLQMSQDSLKPAYAQILNVVRQGDPLQHAQSSLRQLENL